ncbi:hypothetical protein KR093_008029 [Drosophila rubida]|uniref:C2H2-type domain-containing protein n=1 Tax=Drosophila rubida TaxID=30044 RepID=A0AAD4KAT5_9MUSC|nr:hypothetical protein KR093_008029 [Drosophila rubida]
MSDSADEIVEVNSESPQYNEAKVQQLRDCAPFVRTLVTKFRNNMADEQWKKLNMLGELLESDMSSAMFYARFTESKLVKIEAVINKLKLKYGPLLNPTEVIVIDGEQPTTSTARSDENRAKGSAEQRLAAKRKTSETSNVNATGTGTLRVSAKTNTVKGTGRISAATATAHNKPEGTRRSKESTATATAAGINAWPTMSTAIVVYPPSLSRTSFPAATAKLTDLESTRTAKQMATSIGKETNSLSFDLTSSPDAATKRAELERRVNPPAPAPPKSRPKALLQPVVAATSKPTAETERITNPPAPPEISGTAVRATKPDFERRANPPRPSKPTSDVNLPLAPPLAVRLSDIDSSIGSRRKDYVRRSPRYTQSPIHPTPLAEAASKSAVFERRQKAPAAESQRKSNPPAPESVASSSDDGSTKAALEEARKKLAALRGTPETSTASASASASSPALVASPTVSPAANSVPMASNCNDPRGRNSGYRSSSNIPPPIPPKPSLLPITGNANGAMTWPHKESIPQKDFQLPQPVSVIATVSANNKTTSVIPGPTNNTNNNNNNNHNMNLNMSKAPRVSSNMPQSLNQLSSPGSADYHGNFPSCNNSVASIAGQDVGNTRRYGNLNGAVDSRDPRCAKWGQGSGSASQQQLAGAQYSPQSGPRRGPASGWQTSNNNNNNSYNPGAGNQSGGNINSPMWNNNNNNNNHFGNGSPNFGYNNRSNQYNRNGGGGCGGIPPGPNTAQGKSPGQYPSQSPVARTYREHLAAKAKQQEMQRQLEAAEKQRQVEAAAAEKKRKLQEAEKQRQLDEQETLSPNVESDKVQLDTSYRNVALTGGNPNKKLDFKIPKKTGAEKVSEAAELKGQKTDSIDKSEEQVVANNNNSEKPSSRKSSKKSKTDKVHKGEKVSKTVRFENEKVNKAENTDKAEKVHKGDRTDKADQTEKVSKADKSDKSSKAAKAEKVNKSAEADKSDNAAKKHSSVSSTKKSKSEKKKDEESNVKATKSEADNDKGKHLSKKDKPAPDKPKTKEDTDKKKPQVENTDNVENEPPKLAENSEPHAADKSSEVESEDSQQASSKRSHGKSKPSKPSTLSVGSATEGDKNADEAIKPANEEAETEAKKAQPKNTADEHKEEKIEPECKSDEPKSEELPKVPKVKVVLGANPHAMVVIPGDAINSNESPLKTMPELKRILKRRKSMMPTASKPLIDKLELFGGVSLDYEDLIDHKREQEKQQLKGKDEVTPVKFQAEPTAQRINRNLAIMFEKTSDNCSISTQNILAGKRRSRLNELTLNETQLSRNVFKTQLARAKRDSSKAGTNPDSPKRKRGRPRKDPDDSPTQQEKLSPSTKTTVGNEDEHLLLPPPRKKVKRSEVEKLNDDIAQMHYANDVLRVIGRRTYSAQPQLRRSSSSSSLNNSQHAEFAPFIRNVARRGRHYAASRGFNRAAFKTQHVRRQQTRKCVVRVARCAQLQRMLKDAQREVAEPTRATNVTCLVKNVNPEWHSQSSAVTSCVICAKDVRFPMSHYVQCHGEFYGARLPPNVLDELRTGKLSRPIYRTGTPTPKYNHHCVFCQKQLEIANTSWVEHYARHTGEFNFQCSHCNLPRIRQIDGEKHVAKCAPDAKLIVLSAFRRTAPVVLYVCRLCNFCQLSQQNLKKHLQHHHDVLQPTIKDLNQQLTIYNIDDVPVAHTKAAAKRLVVHHRGELAKPMKKKKLSKLNPKVRIKLTKNSDKLLAKTEPLEQASSQPVATAEAELPEETVCDVTDSLGMPPSRPDEEQLLVINECKLEQSEDIPGSSQPGREPPRFEQTAEQRASPELEVLEELDVDGTSSPKLEVSIAIPQTPVSDRLAAGEGDAEKEASPATKELISNQVPEEGQQHKPEEEVEQQREVEEQEPEIVEHSVGQLLESQPDVEQGSQPQPAQQIAVETQQEQQPEQELDPEEERELSPEQRTKESSSSSSSSGSSSRSLFRNFNKLCNKLKSRGSRSSTSSSGSASNVRVKSTNSPAPSSIECEAAVSETQDDCVIVDLPPTQTISPAMLYLISVQNVAFRLRGSPILKAAYYCRYPNCSFLFSNELEGLENHFARDHQSVRWNGSCTGCNLPAKEVPDELSIREELRHMVLVHMDKTMAPKLPQPEVVVPPPEPVLPKLRVRRFTGDRLVPDPVQEAEIEPEPALPKNALVANENTMLRGLLAATPRPSSQQQQELNAAGVGEFLHAKTPPTASDTPGVINRNTELGLLINQVYSLADVSAPLITGETVPLPVVSNNDFVLTQSLTQNFEGPIPTEINISIEPRQESPTPVANAGRREGQPRTQLIADRFRCMALNCNYCAHTVMCIREHMKFHRFSFGSKDYLQCAYCSHVARDVNDYVQHGVIEHGLANREELQEPNLGASAALSQRIRDVLQKRNAPLPASSTAAAVGDNSTTESTTEQTTRGETPICLVFEELLRDTGYSDDKLYACPFKGCNVNLTEDAFVNHVRYHKSSNPNTGPLVCKFCSQTNEKAMALRAHLQHMHQRHKYFCSICLETTVNPRLMLQHMRSLHEAEFQKLNFQQHFLELTAASDASDMPKCWVSAMEQPFGQEQMEDFLSRLIEELRVRRNNKWIYRPSELHLVAKRNGGHRQLMCAECKSVTNEPKALFTHLLRHREQAVRLAYPVEEAATPAAAAMQPAQQELITTIEAPTTAASEDQHQADEQLPIVPAKVAVPGRQLVMPPRYQFVPKELRYKCGVPDCGQQWDTELAFRQHLTTRHSYTDVYKCPHCQYEERSLVLEKLLEHLSHHKRHIYQCGACTSFMPRRSCIDRHIHDKHAGSGQDVDVIIHRRDIATTLSKPAEVRWFKSGELL